MRHSMDLRANMENVAIILNRPKYPGNIGSAARCAKNMGIDRLIVVSSSGYEADQIRMMATHCAGDIVENIAYVATLREALAGFHYVVGTTARVGRTILKRHMVEPSTMGEKLVDISQNNTIALLFGPEDRGLTNEELRFCDLLVTIPTAGTMRSINLSHAVMIICYEVFRARHPSQVQFTPRRADVGEMENMYEHMKDIFLKINFINPENPDYFMINIRNFFSRMNLTSRDVKILRGICHQIDLYGQGKTKDLTRSDGKLKKSE